MIGCTKVNKQSETRLARSANWPNSWLWLALIFFRSWLMYSLSDSNSTSPLPCEKKKDLDHFFLRGLIIKTGHFSVKNKRTDRSTYTFSLVGCFKIKTNHWLICAIFNFRIIFDYLFASFSQFPVEMTVPTFYISKQINEKKTVRKILFINYT